MQQVLGYWIPRKDIGKPLDKMRVFTLCIHNSIFVFCEGLNRDIPFKPVFRASSITPVLEAISTSKYFVEVDCMGKVIEEKVTIIRSLI